MDKWKLWTSEKRKWTKTLKWWKVFLVTASQKMKC